MSNLFLSRRSFLAPLCCAGLFSARAAFATQPDLRIEAFRAEVIAIGERRLSDMALHAGRSKWEVISGDHFLDLGNIFAETRGLPAQGREEMIVLWLSHFSPAANARNDEINTATDDWSKALPLLRPRLMARLQPAVIDRLVSQPFVADLTIIYTIDMGNADLYVSKDKAARWDRPLDEVHNHAITNLEKMSAGIGNEPYDKKGALLNVMTGDGYDAARLILPGLRTRLLGMLGGPYRAAAPSRDLLMVWSKGDDPFEATMAALVRDTASSKDHPVSPLVFECDPQGVRPA